MSTLASLVGELVSIPHHKIEVTITVYRCTDATVVVQEFFFCDLKKNGNILNLVAGMTEITGKTEQVFWAFLLIIKPVNSCGYIGMAN